MVPKAFGFSMVGVVLLLAACGPGKGEPPGQETEAARSATGPRPLTPAEREDFYHLTEGSEVIPLAWVRALRDSSTGRPFLENPERFGLIPDPSNANGLPVGVTAGETVDTRFLRVQMMGFNCAACHVNEITYRGNRIRVDGAPSRFDADGFKAELAGSIQYTVRHPHVLLRFIRDLARMPHSPADAEALRLPSSRDPLADKSLQSLADDSVAPHEAAFLAALGEELRADSLRFPAVDLEKVPFDSAHPAHQQLRARYSREQGRTAESRLRKSLEARGRSCRGR